MTDWKKILAAGAAVLALGAAPAAAQDDNDNLGDEAGAYDDANDAEWGADWDEWDANDDDQIGENEWNDGFGDTGVFNTWDSDSDGMLSDDEYMNGTFDYYDQDDNGYLDESEYGSYWEDNDDGFWDF